MAPVDNGFVGLIPLVHRTNQLCVSKMIMNHIQIRGKSAADDGKEVLHFELGSTRDILVTMLNRKKKKTHRVSSLAAPGGAGFRRDTG